MRGVGNWFATYIIQRSDRYGALKAFLLQRGSLEPRPSDVPDFYEIEFAADTMPRFPRKHDDYFENGGTHSPDRWIVSPLRIVDDGQKVFADPFTHWPEKFPRPIIVAPVVRGYGGWAIPYTQSAGIGLSPRAGVTGRASSCDGVRPLSPRKDA